MVNPENRLFCRLDGLTATTREQQRLLALAELGLPQAGTIPVFEEATQTAARCLKSPICILGFIERDRQCFQSAVGLSQLGLMNTLAASRQIPRDESFGTYVVDSGQVLAINNATENLAFSNSMLVQHYGIHAYLGAPLLVSEGHCIGTLAVMDLEPRNFTAREIEILTIIARWSMSEFERNRLLDNQLLNSAILSPASSPNVSQLSVNPSKEERLLQLDNSSPGPSPAPTNQIKVELLTQLTQELRTPLTSVMGMTSVLNREIYGPLTDKQKEYLEVIQSSGQYLLSLVNEILELGALEEDNQTLDLAAVDIEMICQQAINTLEEIARRQEQEIRLTVEPSHRIWLLDKNKIRQMLYHLVFSVIQAAEAGSVVRIHISRKNTRLNIAVWVSHPWLGDGIPLVEKSSLAAVTSSHSEVPAAGDPWEKMPGSSPSQVVEWSLVNSENSEGALLGSESPLIAHLSESNRSREQLGLFLSCRLAEIHGGQISVQGSAESGYRYVVSLPQMEPVNERI